MMIFVHSEKIWFQKVFWNEIIWYMKNVSVKVDIFQREGGYLALYYTYFENIRAMLIVICYNRSHCDLLMFFLVYKA